ncbi:CCA tRNA nucleotidyltransferase [Peptostreptococcus equinus]|uniref:CCA tRNA nucleotidyltransferase n=1 Tax=Peptostreptococcus equinus TaxID=3003601 RepID=A0ABY7JPW4_9FIRM|nr:CCA tRNA nucleotidyltransferase [Peptostreptococcus sp. CBA3647]WAW14198.1 CCA tRNA nucleotidyltransferase [Peptostreptococcus sp. CBA3647]
MEKDLRVFDKEILEKKLKDNIDIKAVSIIDRLHKHGFEAYIVGGCVRDIIMDKKPNDWDITTNALPEDIIVIFEKTVPTGVQHGTVSVLIDSDLFELTTYRIDGKYLDYRRPENVEFSNSLKDDLSRRDFTINALAYNNISGLIDEFNGIEDIKNKIISCVGNPDKRFNEDALRIIRAIRFSAKLGFTIDDTTFKSIEKNAKNIKNISIERINLELEKIIEFDPEKIKLLNRYSMSEFIFSGYIPNDDSINQSKKIHEIALYFMNNIDIKENTQRTIESLGLKQFFKYNADLSKLDQKNFMAMKRALIFKGVEYEKLHEILKKLRYSNKNIEKTEKIFYILNNKETELLLNDNLEKVKYKMILKKILNYMQDVDLVKCALFAKFIEKFENPTFCFQAINDIILRGECFSVSQLSINGRDIIENNIAQGAEIGYILDSILDYVMEHPESNEKKKLLSLSRKIQNNNINWRYDHEL